MTTVTVTKMTLVAGTLYATVKADGSGFSEKTALATDSEVETVSCSATYNAYVLGGTFIYVTPADEQAAMDAYWAAREG